MAQGHRFKSEWPSEALSDARRPLHPRDGVALEPVITAAVSIAGRRRERSRPSWRHSMAVAARRAGWRRAAFFHRADGFLGLTALQPFLPGELR